MSIASVIIPAHNEEATIGECLDSVLASTVFDDLDVVVVSNGCNDRTVEVIMGYVERSDGSVRSIDTEIGSKARALELGRRATEDGPRIYLDADIVVSPDALASALLALSIDGIEGTAPRIELAEPTGSSWALRAYADIWRRAPYFSHSLIGSGFYGLSAEAQARIGEWPVIIADDLVALCHLDASERQTASPGWFRHTLPSRLRDVAGVEVRREAGRMEFGNWAKDEGRDIAEEDPGGRWLLGLTRSPARWPGIILFVGVKGYAKVRARRALRNGAVSWGQDQYGRHLRGVDTD